jgi:hypothetical protein
MVMNHDSGGLHRSVEMRRRWLLRSLPAGARVCRPGFPPGRTMHLAKAHRTIDLRIRISRRGGGNARCSDSRARIQRKDFSALTLPSSTPSTSSATSLPLQRIALCAPRRSARGARQLRPLKISRAAGPSRSFVGNVTRPFRIILGQRRTYAGRRQLLQTARVRTSSLYDDAQPEVRGQPAPATYGFTICFGSTTRSNSASVTRPD